MLNCPSSPCPLAARDEHVLHALSSDPGMSFCAHSCTAPETASYKETHEQQLCGLRGQHWPCHRRAICRTAHTQVEHFLNTDRPYITQSPAGHCKCFESMRHLTRARAGLQTGMKPDLVAQCVRTIFQLYWKQGGCRESSCLSWGNSQKRMRFTWGVFRIIKLGFEQANLKRNSCERGGSNNT